MLWTVVSPLASTALSVNKDVKTANVPVSSAATDLYYTAALLTGEPACQHVGCHAQAGTLLQRYKKQNSQTFTNALFTTGK